MKKIYILMILISSILNLQATTLKDFINLNQCDQIINKKIYSICYSYKYKGALSGWTTLYGNEVNSLNIKKRPRFYADKTIPYKYRTNYRDYTGWGKIWNRGHFIIADADADYSKKSLHLVYDMANIIPQAAKVNQKTWLKVERYGRYLATQLGNINSISIAKYKNSQKEIKNHIVIPTGYYRIYFNDKANFKKCFYYKNNPQVDYKNDKLKNHLIDCKILERN